MKRTIPILLLCLFVAGMSCAQQKGEMSLEEVTEYWHSGKTLPVEFAQKYQLDPLRMRTDNGYNILIDVSHSCTFNSMWISAGRLTGPGYRFVTSQASLHSVLDPDGVGRIRIPFNPEERVWPFGWYPNFRYNVIFTEQGNSENPAYLPAEMDALDSFASDGGGIVIFANPGREVETSSVAELISRFGASVTAEVATHDELRCAVLNPGEGWETVTEAEGKPVVIRREWGKGRIYVMGSSSFVYYGNNVAREKRPAMDKAVTDVLAWLCADQQPVGGEPRLPSTMGGGGAIFPEKEVQNGDIVVYYAENQKPEIVDVATGRLNAVTDLVMGWLPSPKTNEPMYLVLSGGSGGGWAVNARMPKENGIISMDEAGIVSIFAHELAHTMRGPLGRGGKVAGSNPFGNSGEAHAGWFQGKIDAYYDDDMKQLPNKRIKIFEHPDFFKMDLKAGNVAEEWGKGTDWNKIWYIWQKLDDRYGPTWYPRWLWVQHTRWQDTPEKRLTWEESVEDMSIAVGEDLFPFFRAVGTSLDRANIGEVTFEGTKLSLKPAPIEPTAPGKVRLDRIGDYTKPLNY